MIVPSAPEPDRAEAFFARLMDGPLSRPQDQDTTMPTRVSGWAIHREIGHGGGARVFAASRPTPTGVAHSALKLARRGSDHAHTLFDREAALLRRLQPPIVARLFEAGTYRDGRPFLALEVVEGESVTDHARTLRPRGRLQLAATLCQAVGALHDAGVIHADLKPDHLIVRPSGEVTVLDLGLARDTALEASIALKGAGGAPTLTPEFAAPEQVLGGPVGFEADVYALGLIVYEVILGRPQPVPWVLGGIEDALDLPAEPNEVPAGSPWSSVDWSLVTALRASVHPDPERRFATAGAFARALRDVLDATADA